MGTDTLRAFDAVLFGAVGDPGVEESVSISGLILPLRRRFDLFVNLRPNVLYPGVTSPLRNMEAGDIDMAVVRENTEGEYADVGGFQYHGMDDEVAIQTGVFTRRGIERVVAVRLRAGPAPGQEEGNLSHQVQRPAIQHDPVGQGLQGRRRRLPGY